PSTPANTTPSLHTLFRSRPRQALPPGRRADGLRRRIRRAAPPLRGNRDAVSQAEDAAEPVAEGRRRAEHQIRKGPACRADAVVEDRKSTRLNSSHEWISY